MGKDQGDNTIERRAHTKNAHTKRLMTAKTFIGEQHTCWDNVLWTDETKVFLFSNTVPRSLFIGAAHKEKYTSAAVKHGEGSIMLSGFFPASGTGDIRCIKGMMKSEDYQGILE